MIDYISIMFYFNDRLHIDDFSFIWSSFIDSIFIHWIDYYLL